MEDNKEPVEQTLEQINGRTEERLKTVAELEELFGTSRTNPFGTTEPELFEKKLSELNYADMQKLAGRVGLSPYIERARIKDELRRAFKTKCKEVIGGMTIPRKPATHKLNPKDPQDLACMKALGMTIA